MVKERLNIKISVRNLVEFILREGDIDNRRSRKIPDAMQEGSRIHRKIQKSMPVFYKAEVPLNVTIHTDEYDLLVEGRADGIFEEDTVTIDEIKGIYRELAYLEEPYAVHVAQAKCYAYMYALTNNISAIKIRMTYCSLLTEEIKYFHFSYVFSELEEWFSDVINSYKKWADFSFHWKAGRKASIKQLSFPFPYREGQKDLAAGVYRTIYHGKKLFLQAGTGVGKTISTIFPAVKAIGEGLSDKIFYLTAKTITANVAIDTFEILRERGLVWKSIHLTAKEKICLCHKTDCNPSACQYARGHYDRINDALFALITEEDVLTRECIANYAGKYRVCPFEMSLDASMWVDAVIGDYNYVFDPNAQLKRFSSEKNKGDYIFLIDEAHNLVDRARDMYSAQLIKEDFLKIKKLVRKNSLKLEKNLERCNKALLELKKECDTYLLLKQINAFYFKLLGLYAEFDKFLEEETEINDKEEVISFYFAIRHFIAMYESMDDHSLLYSEILDNGNFKLKLYCVNPANKINECLKGGKSTLFFSATLLPVTYYYNLLGGTREDYSLYAKPPFDTEKRCILIADDVSSKYTRRNYNEYEKIALYIKNTLKAKRGNYLVFFPSYRYLHEVYDIFGQKYKEEGDTLLIQDTGMTEREKEEFLEAFIENAESREDKNLIGFCVMGGIFSEGIDLKENQLIGSVIVGTGLPQITNEGRILSDYFNMQGLNGFNYAYRYPGMNKILQAAGRVIRTVNDEGIILLLDERFLEKAYQRLFPMEWTACQICNLKTVSEKLNDFWQGRENQSNSK